MSYVFTQNGLPVKTVWLTLCVMRLLMISRQMWPSCSLKCKHDWSPASCVQHLDSQSIAYHQSKAALTCHRAKNHKAASRLNVAKLAFVSCNIFHSVINPPLESRVCHVWLLANSITADADRWFIASHLFLTSLNSDLIAFWEIFFFTNCNATKMFTNRPATGRKKYYKLLKWWH